MQRALDDDRMSEPQENNDDLFQQLDEKNQLIAALTERLEQAAEQLDRNHRNGSDRGVRLGGGGVPAEFVEQQQALANDVHQMVEQWDQMQAGATLGRIELQVGELRDYLAQRLDKLHVSASPAPTSSASDESSVGSVKQYMEAVQPTAAAPDANSYENLKAQLLGDEIPTTPAAPAEELPEVGSTVSEPIQSNDTPAVTDVAELPDGPEPIDVESASLEILQQAVLERDQYIMLLIQKMRSSQKDRLLDSNWKELESVPHDLHATLCELQADLNKTLRMAEVEFSLERARMGREANHLKQARAELEREMRHLSRNANGSADGDESDESAGFSNRWKRLMGKG